MGKVGRLAIDLKAPTAVGTDRVAAHTSPDEGGCITRGRNRVNLWCVGIRVPNLRRDAQGQRTAIGRLSAHRVPIYVLLMPLEIFLTG